MTASRAVRSLPQVRSWVSWSRPTRLGSAHSIEDLRRLARLRVPRVVFEFVDGGAEDGEVVRRNAEALRRARVVTRVLVDVSAVDLSTRLLDAPVSVPFGVAPTGLPALSHPDAEDALVDACARRHVPFVLSSMGTRSNREIAARNTGRPHWFQLYVWRDRVATRELIEQARAAGAEGLVVTVDVPVPGFRPADVRNGLTVPPTINPRSAFGIARHPGWMWGFLASGGVERCTFGSSSGALADLGHRMFDSAVTFEDLAWLRDIWSGPLAVKGILDPRDARAALELGVDVIWVSNHGGRQSGRAPASLDALREIRREVGLSPTVWFDSGIRSGLDVAVALQTGADFVFAGRPFIYGLMAGGAAGVDRAFEILATELERALALAGSPSVASIGSPSTL